MSAHNFVSSVFIARDEKIIKTNNKNARNYKTVAMACLKVLSQCSAEEPKKADEM
jgi:hypothetical protein